MRRTRLRRNMDDSTPGIRRGMATSEGSLAQGGDRIARRGKNHPAAIGLRLRSIASDPRDENLSSQLRNDGSRRAAVSVVVGTESFHHGSLFDAALDLEACIEQYDRNYAAYLSLVERSSNHRDDHSRINRVSHPAIRSGTNQLMVDLHGDVAAPVAAEVSARPHGKAEPSRGQHNCQDAARGTAG